jgi:hypothetical protein
MNECTNVWLNNCHVNAVCTNTNGGFNCKCKAGFTGDGVSCQKNSDPCDKCSKMANCEVDYGVKQCVCKKGYNGNGEVCETAYQE